MPGRVRRDTREHFFTERAVRPWNRLLGEAGDAPSLSVSQRRLGNALHNVLQLAASSEAARQSDWVTAAGSFPSKSSVLCCSVLCQQLRSGAPHCCPGSPAPRALRMPLQRCFTPCSEPAAGAATKEQRPQEQRLESRCLGSKQLQVLKVRANLSAVRLGTGHSAGDGDSQHTSRGTARFPSMAHGITRLTLESQPPLRNEAKSVPSRPPASVALS